VVLDRDATVDKAGRLREDAAANGAGPVVVSEAFVRVPPTGFGARPPGAEEPDFNKR